MKLQKEEEEKKQKNQKIVIGLVGAMGSGKSTVARHFKEKYQAGHHTFSDPLRAIAKNLYLPETRNNLQNLFLALAQEFGEDILARPMKKTVEEDAANLVIIEGIRRSADIIELKKLPCFYLIGIISDEEKRYERITARTENIDDKNKTYEEFLKDQQKKPELLIADLIALADYRVENNGEFEEFIKEMEKTIEVIILKSKTKE
ncbi:MAG: AAA family ATPase [Patescibacteria group bacterium]|nr:MAG: AAA family ATPase [Patescibacteria group bacterium]